MGPIGVWELVLLLFFAPFIIACVLALFFSWRSSRDRESS
jgi:hypothetical protein